MRTRNRSLPLTTLPVLGVLVVPLLACETGDVDEELLEAMLVEDEMALDETLVAEPVELDEDLEEDFDEDLDPPDPEGQESELSADPDPSAVFANWVGNFGGTLRYDDCPYAYTAIGIAAAPSTSGNVVRQIALVCGLESEVEEGQFIPTGQQSVIASGYLNSGFQVNASHNWRLAWDASAFSPFPWQRYKAPNTTIRLCDAGYRLNKVDVREGSTFVTRINSMTCWWDGPGSQGPRGMVYSTAVNVGSHTGGYDSSSCQSTSENFADGIQFRYSGWLRGFRLDCEE